MQMPGFEFYEKREWLNITSLDTFCRCPRRFFYGIGCGLVQEGGPHTALLFGEAIHKALPLASTEGFEAALAAFDSIWTADNPLDELRTRYRASVILKNYAAQNGPGFGIYQLVKPEEISSQLDLDRQSEWEVPFAVQLPGLRLPLVGRIDGMARHRDTKELWLVEYKTGKEVGDRLMSAFTLSPQVLAYTLAARTMSSEPIKGVFVHALQVAKTVCQLPIRPVYIQDHHLEEFIQWAVWKGNELLQMEEMKNFPKDFSGCHPYAQFGIPGYECDFMKLCLPADWTFSKSLYQKREYNPYKLTDDPAPAKEPVQLTVKGSVPQ